MRGIDEPAEQLFGYIDLEAQVRHDHPLRAIVVIVNKALRDLAGDFTALYSRIGRPSMKSFRLRDGSFRQQLPALGATPRSI